MHSKDIFSFKKPLKRDVTLTKAVMYGTGIIVGAGVYVLIGRAAGMTGNSLWLSFIIAAFIASLTALSYAELASMFPKSAAEYIYTKRAFHKKILSFSLGWLIIFTGIVSAATVSLGFGMYFQNIFGLNYIISAILLLLFLSYINYRGVRESMNLNLILTTITIFGLILIILFGLPYLGNVNYFDMPFGFSGVFLAASFIFFAFIGFEDIANIAEETKNPKKNIPLALIIAIILTCSLYVLVSLTAVSVVDWQILGKSDAPLAVVADKLMPNGSFILSFIALFATASTVLILLIATSRFMYGMAKEKSLPYIFSNVHPKRRTPWIAVITTFFVAAAFILSGNIVSVAKITNFGAFLIFAFVNISLIMLRYKEPFRQRRFKVPLNVGKFPIPSFFGLIFCLFMLTRFDLITTLICVFVILAGLLLYRLLDDINRFVLSVVKGFRPKNLKQNIRYIYFEPKNEEK